jgi:hypothetical protein
MRRTIIVFALAGLTGEAAYTDEAPMSATLTAAQAQARQLGIFFGGTATGFDLCVKKGFLPKGDRSAEETARSLLEKMRATNQGADESAYVQDGWDMMKKEISENESFYTQEKCSFVGKEWAKILATMKK